MRRGYVVACKVCPIVSAFWLHHLSHSFRYFCRFLSVGAVLTLLCFPATAQPPVNTSPHVPDELLLQPRGGVPNIVLDDIFSQQGAHIKEVIPAIDGIVLKVPSDRLGPLAAALSRNPNFKFVEKNYLAEGARIPNDSLYVNQWHLPKISAPAGWDLSTGNTQTVIAILDSGIDPTHPDLKSKLLSGYNYLGGNTNTNDVLGHGTAVAGAAAAVTNNTSGVSSIAWQNPILPLVVLNSSNYASYANIASAIIYAADRGAKVISISIGGSSSSSTLQNAVNYAWNKGAVIVACAMNNSSSTPMYPAALTNVLAIAATDQNDQKASFSNYGAWIDLAAPGVNILTTNRGGGYGGWNGTSLATPITAGLVALLFSAKPTLTNTQVVDILKRNSDDRGTAGFDIYFGYGRINVYKALQAALGATTQAADTTAPSVSITSPLSGTTVSGTISVSVSASDNVGITKVALYLDGALFASDTTSPFSFAWDTTKSANGSHSLSAIAYDAAGNSKQSQAITVTTNNTATDITPPTVAITSPANGARVTKTIQISVRATDNIRVQQVTVSVDGKTLGTALCSASSCTTTFAWNTQPTKSGAHTLVAVARDAAGNTKTSSIVTMYK